MELAEELFAGSNPPTRIAKIRLRQLLCSIKCLEEGIVGKSLTEFLNQVVEVSECPFCCDSEITTLEEMTPLTCEYTWPLFLLFLVVVQRERSFGSVLVAATVKDITCELENLAPPYRTHDFQSLLREILDDIVERRHIFQEFSDIKQSLLLRIENLSHVTKGEHTWLDCQRAVLVADLLVLPISLSSFFSLSRLLTCVHTLTFTHTYPYTHIYICA